MHTRIKLDQQRVAPDYYRHYHSKPPTVEQYQEAVDTLTNLLHTPHHIRHQVQTPPQHILNIIVTMLQNPTNRLRGISYRQNRYIIQLTPRGTTLRKELTTTDPLTADRMRYCHLVYGTPVPPITYQSQTKQDVKSFLRLQQEVAINWLSGQGIADPFSHSDLQVDKPYAK